MMRCAAFSCFAANPTIDHTVETSSNREIGKNLKFAEKENKKTIRILLLGPGSSGKTTIVKQMKKIHCDDDVEELNNRKRIARHIKASLIDYMKILCTESIVLDKKYNANTSVSKDNEHLLHDILSYESPYELTYDITQKIKILWADKGIKNTLAKREYFQIAENADYFFDRIDCICTTSYVPSFEDYIRFRREITAGLHQTTIQMNVPIIGPQKFHFTDVGGQRSERRKWMHYISDDINVVIYVVALSDYDLTMYEDNETNRLVDSIELFREIMIKTNFFMNKSVFLFFNKYDLFIEKIKRTSIRVTFDDFPMDKMNPNDADDVVRFVAGKFWRVFYEANATLKAPFHVLRTTALDTNNMEKIFNMITVDMVQENFRGINML